MIKFKKFFCLLVLISLVTSSVSSFALEPAYVMELSPVTKFYINRNGGISHNTYIIEAENQKMFFKATKEKLSMYDTAKRAINEYFKDDYKTEQASMLKSLLNEENLNKFIYMKTYDDGKAAKWLVSENKTDTSELGFTEPLSANFKRDILPAFLPYAFAEFVQYRANKNREIGDLQINQLLGALATMRIAKILNLSDLVVKTEYINVKTTQGDDKLGIVMECAKGMPFRNVKLLENKKVNPSLQLNLSKLMILDAICAQRDRSVGNYFTFLSENGDIAGISAFDNDLAFDNYSALCSYTDLREKNFVLPAILRHDGTFYLPHMDKGLADKILSLNYKDIHLCLEDLLSDAQIDAVINRIHQLQNAIKQTVKENQSFLLEPSEWTSQTMEEELLIDGSTYFKSFMNKLNISA